MCTVFDSARVRSAKAVPAKIEEAALGIGSRF